jgi:hypothetical protein
VRSKQEKRLDQARAAKSLIGWDNGQASADARDEVLAAERSLAESRHEQWAEALDLGVVWDAGAPIPHIVSNGMTTVLTCRASDPHPDWDGTNPRVISPDSTESSKHLQFTFSGCASIRFGRPGDETMSGHPLWGRGLTFYNAHLVHNSAWIAELDATDSVHARPVTLAERGAKHYVFTFHDETFEAVARAVEVEQLVGTFSGLLVAASARLVRPESQE